MHELTANTISLEDITEELVIEYLCVHKEFFQHHEDLLEQMYIPQACGPAISLIERQVERLREKNQQLQCEMLETVQIAKDNSRLFDATKALTLQLLSAATLREIIDILHNVLCHDFKADIIRIGLTQLPEDLNNYHGVFLFEREKHRSLKDLLKVESAVCKRLHKEHAHIVFAEDASEVGSSALVPLGRHAKFGVLVIGSRDKLHFHKDMDTLFLDYIGKIVGQLVSRYC